MKTAITHKNTLLHFAQNIAVTKKCNRVFLSPSHEKLKNKKFFLPFKKIKLRYRTANDKLTP
jgi:hypothetical protein